MGETPAGYSTDKSPWGKQGDVLLASRKKRYTIQLSGNPISLRFIGTSELCKRPADNIMTGSYDSWGDLKEVIDPHGNAYCTNNNRKDRKITTCFNVAEADANNTITATYVWGGNRLLVKKLANGAQYYYLYNGHGDVVQIVDTTGNVVNSYQYDEWGNITSQTEGIENEFKYAGQIYDSETGLYYLRARYYDPKIGRFISKDSYEGDITNPLSLNLYTYVENNPVKYFDPTGHATYQIGGLDLAPTFEFDSGFQYDLNAVATDADKKSWNAWGRKAWAAGLVPWLKDAAKMYKHYRGNTGTDMRIEYGRAYKEDDTIKAGIDNEISLMQNFVNSSYKGGAGTSFDIIGDLQGISNGTSENWQKTIGAFYTYG